MAHEPKASLRQGSLVLYKHQAARVASVSRKRLQIELAGGETLRVRAKDVTLLHPGPLQGLNELRPRQGEVTAAWSC